MPSELWVLQGLLELWVLQGAEAVEQVGGDPDRSAVRVAVDGDGLVATVDDGGAADSVAR